MVRTEYGICGAVSTCEVLFTFSVSLTFAALARSFGAGAHDVKLQVKKSPVTCNMRDAPQVTLYLVFDLESDRMKRKNTLLVHIQR